MVRVPGVMRRQVPLRPVPWILSALAAMCLGTSLAGAGFAVTARLQGQQQQQQQVAWSEGSKMAAGGVPQLLRPGRAQGLGLAGLGAVAAALLGLGRRQLRVRRSAEGDGELSFTESLFAPRYRQTGIDRDLPANAEMLSTISVLFSVTLSKPFGMLISDGPDKGLKVRGVGVEAIGESGSVPDLLNEVLAGKDSMWIQEGDELEAVNDENTYGDRERGVEMITAAGDAPVKLTFSRPRKGFIKVVFPGGKQVTSPRAALLSRLAEKVGYDCGCRCTDGRCGRCWHKDTATGEVYILPLNPPGLVPSVWRDTKDKAVSPSEGQFECWVPLVLEPAPEEFGKAIKEEARAKGAPRFGEQFR
ncbi:unnamed protein product [Polarella glacialis]|uniref:PDZ domain-containing protein n=1 Tax=Polarella glacialis TaxID=89957 RepID=A0A813H2L1_POLGL|nr:unnamed protein product [Polarella glacialis]